MKKLSIQEIVEQFAELDTMLKENDWEALDSYEIRSYIKGYRVVLNISPEDEDEE